MEWVDGLIHLVEETDGGFNPRQRDRLDLVLLILLLRPGSHCPTSSEGCTRPHPRPASLLYLFTFALCVCVCC
jgi:hypothetical protein